MTTVVHDNWRIETCAKQAGRETFKSGIEPLDRYLHRQALQDARRGYAAVYVAVELESGQIEGYYTLSMAGVPLAHVPADLRAKMPRYPSVPAVRLGRLAVVTEARGRGLGGLLLLDAMDRALSNEVAWAAFIVDAKDTLAREFYSHYGFLSFTDDTNHLFLPRTTVKAAFHR